MKILYVPDLFTQTDDVTFQTLKNHFKDDEINTISISYDEPKKAIDLIEKAIKSYDLLITTGLGCYLSLGLKDVPKILINFLYPDDIKEQFTSKEEIYVKLKDCEIKRNPEFNYGQQIYNQENTFYLFGTEDEIKNNIADIDCEIQFEKAGGIFFVDGPSPFSGLGARYYGDEETAKKYYGYGNVFEVYSTKHRIDSTSTNCLEAIDKCVDILKTNKFIK